MKRLLSLSLAVSAVAGLFFMSGCGGGQASGTRYYLLDVNRPGSKLKTTGGNVCVKAFKIASAFDGSRLVYKKADRDYESDYYNRFMGSPEVQVTEQFRNWLGKSGIFENVINVSSIASADYVVEGNVVSLYGDFSEADKAYAVMEIRFFLVKMTEDGPTILFSEDYKETVEVSNEGADKLVLGYYECLEKIFSRFEKDVAGLSFE